MWSDYAGSDFLQTSDIHIGECRSLSGYDERHKGILTQIMDTAYNLGLPLLISGDLVHTKSTNYIEQFLLFWWLGELEKRKIRTIIIAGNHDHLWGEVTQLDGFKFMPFNYIKIVTWHPEVVILGDIGVICIPWRGYKTEDIKKIVTEKLPLVEHCKYRVVMLHECISGVRLDSGKVLSTSTSIPSIPEITYWAVGDIHRYQMTNASNGYYAGSPAQYRFDDELPKGIIKVDLGRPSKEPEFLPITSKPLKTITNVEDITDDAYYRLVGDYDAILKANNEPQVVKAEYDNNEERTIAYEKVGICDGLPEFLATKGINEGMQKRAITWISSLLKLKET